jgi:endonuclease/exonuclease/phosphatase family metal-dependent hydrolase
VNSPLRCRIATWNLERPKVSGWTKNQHRLNQIQKINADIWVLTETHKAIQLQNYQSVGSQTFEGYHEIGERLSTIWSRWKVLSQISTFDPRWAVCTEIDSPFGNLIVYGTVLPYANDKGVSGTSKRWEEHRRSIQYHHEDWLRIRQQYPNHPICIAGDFNQSRDQSGWYEDKQSVDMLSAALEDLSLACLTEKDFQEKGLSRSTVDHICLSKTLEPQVLEVDVWEGTTPEGKRMSDHNGIFVDLRVD